MYTTNHDYKLAVIGEIDNAMAYKTQPCKHY